MQTTRCWGCLKPVISRDLGWSEADFGRIVFVFQGGYALMMPITGRIIDWLGTRAGYALVGGGGVELRGDGALVGAKLVSVCGGALCVGIWRGCQFSGRYQNRGGLVPQKDRALATGIFNS